MHLEISLIVLENKFLLDIILWRFEVDGDTNAGTYVPQKRHLIQWSLQRFELLDLVWKYRIFVSTLSELLDLAIELLWSHFEYITLL